MASDSVGQPFGQTSQVVPSRSSSCMRSRQRGHSAPPFISIGFSVGSLKTTTMLPPWQGLAL